MSPPLNRRGLIQMAAAGIAFPGLLRAQDTPARTILPAPAALRHNTASFTNQSWQEHFTSLRKGAILCDLQSRALHYWSEDQSIYLVYPSSVPMSEALTKRGYTEVVLKRRNPTWIPTPNMRANDPSLPDFIGPGPDNPLGSRALNLGWQYYRIHGIDLLSKIGRPASNGCVGLYNPNAERLFDLVEIGTQVRFL
ncbi:MAG: L,D-transpeptidase [Paracoccus sp. (in: a-proteobacteria)]|uniref:L,D-transpeptidase n=1 Tax=Paracoccus sp. TaxID=267 RepID=UPI00391A1FA5